MWQIHKVSVCEIIDSKTNRVVATGIDETQAQEIVKAHNEVLSDSKWEKEKVK